LLKDKCNIGSQSINSIKYNYNQMTIVYL